MRIHEEIRRSVTFVACRRGEDYYVAGTAFFVAVKNSFGGFQFLRHLCSNERVMSSRESTASLETLASIFI